MVLTKNVNNRDFTSFALITDMDEAERTIPGFPSRNATPNFTPGLGSLIPLTAAD